MGFGSGFGFGLGLGSGFGFGFGFEFGLELGLLARSRRCGTLSSSASVLRSCCESFIVSIAPCWLAGAPARRRPSARSAVPTAHLGWRPSERPPGEGKGKG